VTESIAEAGMAILHNSSPIVGITPPVDATITPPWQIAMSFGQENTVKHVKTPCCKKGTAQCSETQQTIQSKEVIFVEEESCCSNVHILPNVVHHNLTQSE
jgi:hypothetical protein